MLGRKLVSTLKIAFSLGARSRRSFGIAVWPIRIDASGSRQSNISSGIYASSETTRRPSASRRLRTSGSQMTSKVRGSGSMRMSGRSAMKLPSSQPPLVPGRALQAQTVSLNRFNDKSAAAGNISFGASRHSGDLGHDQDAARDLMEFKVEY